MPQIESAEEARSVARLIQSGQITGNARDTAMQALRDFDGAHTAAQVQQPQEPAPPPATAAERAGAFGAGANQGIAATLGLPVDTALNVWDLGKAGVGTLQSLGKQAYNEVTGSHVDITPSPIFDPADRSQYFGTSERIARSFDKTPVTSTQLPRPDDPTSRYLAVGGSAVVPALVGARAGGVTNPAGLTRSVMSGVSGAEAQNLAREQGWGPGWQALAGQVGGLAPGAIEETARFAGRAIPNVIRPLTRGGQQQMAANILGDQATNPQAAAQNLQNAQEIVPGSPRTTGEASQDVGLLKLEKGLRSKNSDQFGAIISQQNSAHQAELAALGGRPADIAAAETQRAAATDPMRAAAFKAAGQADVQPVHDTIDSILASPVGKRESVAKSLEWAKGQIGDTTDPASLYEIRKDLQLAQRGKLTPSSPNAPNASTLALARGQLGDVVSSLDDQIEQAAPGFKAYLQRYKDMSKPIDQMKVIQEIQRRAELSSVDVTTKQNFLGNANFSRALDSAIQKNGAKLTPDQVERLNAVRTDMQYGQAINSPLIKAPGSDTFQNLSIAQVIGAGATDAHPALRVITRPLDWVYRLAGSDARVNQVLADAMTDPKLAAQMLKQATPASVQKFSDALRLRAYQAGIGTLSSLDATPRQGRSASTTSPTIQ